MSGLRAMLLLGVLLGVPAGPPAWYGLHDDRDAELRSVAANSPPHWQVGATCAEHFAQ